MKLNIAGNQIMDLIRGAERSLILLSSQPSVDSVAAAAALANLIKDSNKKSDIVSFGQVDPELAKIAPGKIQTRLEPTDLVISFNWAQSEIEKVSYSVEGEKFNLIIRPSGKRLDPTAVEYSYRGANYNLVITLGISSVEELPAHLFDRNILANLPLINIDIQSNNTNFGKVNLVDTESDSLSGLVVEILREVRVTFTAKVADALLRGLRSATSNFEFVKNPLTFEQAAYCTKMKNSSAAPASEASNQDWSKAARSSKIS